MARIWAFLPVHLAAACSARVDSVARQTHTPDDPRTLDQVRADVFADLLLATPDKASAVKVELYVTVSAATLMGLSEQPGPAIGDRAPDVDLEGGRTLYDLTRHTGFTLLVLRSASSAASAAGQSLAALQKRFGRVLTTHDIRCSAAVERCYGSTPYDRVLLIRPDGYIGFRGALTELPLLEARLGSMLLL